MGLNNKIINWIYKKTSCLRYKAIIERPLKNIEKKEKFYFLKHKYEHKNRMHLRNVEITAYTVTDGPVEMSDTYDFLATDFKKAMYDKTHFSIQKKDARDNCFISNDLFGTTIISTSLKPLYQYINETHKQIKQDLLVNNKCIFYKEYDGHYEVCKKYTAEILEIDRMQIMKRINSLPTF